VATDGWQQGDGARQELADPTDLLIAATWEDDPDARIAKLIAALAAARDPAAQAHWPGWLLASAEARSLCWLARAGQVPIEDAAEAVERSVAAGEGCFSMASLALAYAERGDHVAALRSARAVPSVCFARPLHAVWRFELWDAQVHAAHALGANADALRCAGVVVGAMQPHEADDSPEPWMCAPHQTVDVLLALAAAADDEPDRSGALRLLARMRSAAHLDDWFPAATVARIEAALAVTPPN
jgi:hypothetical protein